MVHGRKKQHHCTIGPAVIPWVSSALAMSMPMSHQYNTLRTKIFDAACANLKPFRTWRLLSVRQHDASKSPRLTSSLADVSPFSSPLHNLREVFLRRTPVPWIYSRYLFTPIGCSRGFCLRQSKTKKATRWTRNDRWPTDQVLTQTGDLMVRHKNLLGYGVHKNVRSDNLVWLVAKALLSRTVWSCIQ